MDDRSSKANGSQGYLISTQAEKLQKSKKESSGLVSLSVQALLKSFNFPN